MFPSPAPSPSPSPGPAFLYLNSHGHHQSASHGGGAGAAGVMGPSAAAAANGASPFGPPNGAGGGFPLGRFPQQAVGWGPRSHQHPVAHHQQNPSLSSLPGSVAHSSAASSLNANGGPPSPAYGSLPGHHHHHPHHHAHAAHTPSNLSHIPSPSTLHTGANSHMSSGSSSAASVAAAAAAAAAANASPHWQQQLIKAEVSIQ